MIDSMPETLAIVNSLIIIYNNPLAPIVVKCLPRRPGITTDGFALYRLLD